MARHGRGRRVLPSGKVAVAVLGLVTVLSTTGCSYTPARIDTGPLVEFGGYHDGHRRHERRHRHYRRHDYHDRDDWERRSHHRHHRDRRHRSRFCPPGQAMKGRC